MKLSTKWGFVSLTAALIVYQLGIAIGVAIFGDGADRWFFVFITSLGAALAIAGLMAASRSPMRSGLLVAVGVVPSILMFWMIIPPVIALGVAVYAVLNGRKRQQELGAIS